MCGKNYGKQSNLILPVLLSAYLLFSVSANLHADSETTEVESLLTECAERLETTTNELEASLNLNQAWKTWSVTQSKLLTNAMNLNAELIAARKADAERFKAIETSLTAYEKTVASERWRARWHGWIEGGVVGVAFTALAILLIQ